MNPLLKSIFRSLKVLVLLLCESKRIPFVSRNRVKELSGRTEDHCFPWDIDMSYNS